MNMDILKSFTEQMQGFASPLTRYNQLLAVSKVQDTQSLAALGTVQLETASQLSRQMLDDIQKLSALGQQFKEELDVLTADGIKKSTGKA